MPANKGTANRSVKKTAMLMPSPRPRPIHTLSLDAFGFSGGWISEGFIAYDSSPARIMHEELGAVKLLTTAQVARNAIIGLRVLAVGQFPKKRLGCTDGDSFSPA